MSPFSFRQWLQSIQQLRSRSRRPASRSPRRLILEELECRTLPAVVNWIGATGGDWDTASNWFDASDTVTPNHVPRAADSAVIGTAGITVNHAVGNADTVANVTSAASFSLSAGSLAISNLGQFNSAFTLTGASTTTLTGSGTVTLAGPTTWSNGTMSGTGLTILKGTTVAGTVSLDTRALENQGTVNHVDSTFNFANGGTVNNDAGAVWNTTVTAFSGSFDAMIGSGSFNNAGTLNSSDTATVSLSIPTFSNAGTVNIQSGTLQLFASAVNAYSFTDGSSVNGPGNFQITNFTPVLTVTGSSTIGASQFSFNGGTLTGSGTVTVTGAFGLQGSTMNGTGATILKGASALSGNTLNTRTLDNFGTVTDSNSNILVQNAVINNEAGATWNLQNTSGVFSGGTASTFNNFGTLNQASGPGATFTLAFNNSGTVNVQSGTLTLFAFGTESGSFSVGAGAELQFDGSTYDLIAGSSISGAGSITFSAGTVNVNAGFTPTGPITIDGGTANFANTVNGSGSATFTSLSLSTGTLTGSGTVTVTGATTWTTGVMSGTGLTILQGSTSLTSGGTSLDTRTLNNFGTVNQVDGTLFLLNAAVVNNEPGATWNMSLTGALAVTLLSGSGSFNNAGTLTSSATDRIDIVITGGTSSGTFNVLLGTLELDVGSHTFTSGAQVSGPGIFFLDDTTILDVEGSTTIGSAGFVLNGAFLTGSGTTTVTSATTWDHSTLSGTGLTILMGDSTLAGSNTLDARTVNNFGHVSDGSTFLNVLNGGVINNEIGAVWDLQSDASMAGFGQFHNLGTLQKSAGAGASTIGITSNDSGLVNILSGTLLLNGNSDAFTNATIGGVGTLDLTNDSVTFVGSSTIGSANFIFENGSVLTGGGTVVVTSATTWTTGAAMTGTGLTKLEGMTAVTGAATVDRRTLNNFGTMNQGHDLLVLNGAVVTNEPGDLWDLLGDLGISGTVAETFINLGNFHKSVGTGTSTVATAFNNGGTASVLTGKITILGDGADSGTFTIAAGTTLSFSAGSDTFTNGALVNGPGTFDVSGNELLTVTGSVTFGSGGFTLNSSTINNFGTVADLTTVALSNGAVLNNKLGGVWNLQNNAGILAPGTVNNFGTLQQLTGSGSTLAAVLNNNGAVNVLSGTLQLTGGGTDTGSFSAASGTLLEFNGGTHNLNAGSSLSGAGSITFNAGTVNVSGGFTNTGPITISGATANFANTVNGTGTASFNSLVLASGVLTGSATVTAAGATTWTGGSMSGTGATLFQGATSLTGTPSLDARTLHNFKVVTQDTIDLPFLNNAVVDNESGATWLLTSSAGSLLALSGTGTFNNFGLVQAAPTATMMINLPFNNSGTLEVESGTLTLLANGSNAGTFMPDVGATLAISTGNITFTNGAVATGAGTFDVAGGTLTATGNSTIGSASFSLDNSGILTGSGTVTVVSAFTWTSGTMSGSGSTILQSPSSFSGAGLALDTRTLSLASGGSVLDGAPITLANNATISTGSTTTWNFLGSAAVTGTGVFNNAGTLSKLVGPGTIVLGASFNNSGSVNVHGGTLELDGGGVDSGSFTVDPGVTLTFNGGTHRLNAGSTVTGAGAVNFISGAVTISAGFAPTGVIGIAGGLANFAATVNGSGSASFTSLSLTSGTLTGSATINVIGALTWSGGVMSGTGATNLQGASSLSNNPSLDTRTLNNFNTVTDTAAFTVLNAAVINNEASALWDLQNTAGLSGAGTFNNLGTLQKSTGAGNAGFAPALVNTGTLNVQTGTLTAGTVSNAGTVAIAVNSTLAAASFTQSGGTLKGQGVLSGNVTINGGTVSPGFSPGILTVAGNYTQAANPSLNIEIAGLTPGTQYDVLAVGGTAQLGGTLNLLPLNGFVPQPGDSFQILTAQAVSGTFTTVTGLAINNIEHYVVNYGPTGVSLTVATPSIVSLTTTAGSGTYGVGAVLPITVTFSEAVTLAGGNLTVQLNDGGVVTITPFSNSTTATGTYTIAAGEAANPLDTLSPLLLSGGATLTDFVGNNVTLAVPAGQALANSKRIVVNTVPPITVLPILDKLGVMRAGPSGTGVFTLDNNGDGVFDASDATFTYGYSTDVPLVGDWSGLGFDSVGVVRGNADGSVQWILDSNGDNAYETGDKVYTFGLITDAPLLGDWTGNGKTEIGVARGLSNGAAQFSLDGSGDGVFGAGDQVYNFGLATDKFGAGHWSGPGKDTICVERPDQYGVAVFTFDSNGNGAFDAGDRVVRFGYSSDSFIEGDWNGDGRTKLGVVRPGPNGTVVVTLDTNGDGVFEPNVDRVIVTNFATDALLVGNWRTPAPLHAVAGPRSMAAPPLVLDASFQTLVNSSLNLWAQAGLDSAGLARLRAVDYSVATLGGTTLGLTTGSQITLDATADGHGWSLDPAGPTPGRMDLLSVLLHEQGHVLGLNDLTGASSASDVMGDVLTLGVRRLPTSRNVESIFSGKIGG